MHHDSIGSNRAVVANRNRTQEFRSGPDHYAIANGGVPFAALVTGSAQGDTVVNQYVVTDDCGFANHHTHSVVNEDPATERGTRMNLDPSEKSGELGERTREKAHPATPHCV